MLAICRPHVKKLAMPVCSGTLANTNMDPDIFSTNVNDIISTNLDVGMKISPSLLNESFLWASCVWGAVAGGYLLYACKQREIIPFLAGVAMLGVSFLVASWFWMSVICIALMVGVYLLVKRGH
jgi:hypothetical protein